MCEKAVKVGCTMAAAAAGEGVPCETAAMVGSTTVADDDGASRCLRSAIESLSMFNCASVAAARASVTCSFAMSNSMLGVEVP